MSDGVSRRDVLAALGAGAATLGLGAAAIASAGMPESQVGFRDGKYVLPPLPYPYTALEPHIDEQTMRLHHDKHHMAYVDGLNKALDTLATARRTADFAGVKAASRDLAFNGSGHVLHLLFWNNMRPAAGNPGPSPALTAALTGHFGSTDGFRGQFGAAAKQVEGGGWGLLAYEVLGRRLIVLQAEKHQDLTFQHMIPLLALDVWEHAYYLKYQNNRAAYVDAWWNVVNWQEVERRLDQMTRIMALVDRGSAA